MNEAWQKRPELQQDALNLKNAGIEMKATQNGLLPTLNLFGEYQAIGTFRTETVTTTTANRVCGRSGSPIVDAGGAPAGTCTRRR